MFSNKEKPFLNEPLTIEQNSNRSIIITDQMQNPSLCPEITSISSLLNEFPINSLNDYYDIESSLFKKRIDKLNLKFFWESESLSSQKEIPKPYNKLFIILIKEINLYTEEISRLNNIIRERNKIEKYFKDKVVEFTQKEKERILTKQMLKNYQKSNKLLEKRFKEKCIIEEKLRTEIEKIKQQLMISRENIQVTNVLVQGNANANNFNIVNNVNNIKKQKHVLDVNKRTSNSIDKKSKEEKYNYWATGNNEKKKTNYNKGNEKIKQLNKSMFVGDSKSFTSKALGSETNGNLRDSIIFPMGIDSEIINKCIEHYVDEIENLNEIELFLEKQKQQIKDSFNKGKIKI